MMEAKLGNMSRRDFFSGLAGTVIGFSLNGCEPRRKEAEGVIVKGFNTTSDGREKYNIIFMDERGQYYHISRIDGADQLKRYQPEGWIKVSYGDSSVAPDGTIRLLEKIVIRDYIPPLQPPSATVTGAANA